MTPDWRLVDELRNALEAGAAAGWRHDIDSTGNVVSNRARRAAPRYVSTPARAEAEDDAAPRQQADL